MRWIVTGSQGQLGRCLVRQLEADPREELVRALGHADLDVGSKDAVRDLFAELGDEPADVCVNAAAYTAVDRCESERELAMRVNGEGPGHLAQACGRTGTRLVHVSTDYVFDGHAREPYAVDAPTSPQSVYGASKLEGERRVLQSEGDALVVRTAWVFGPGRNFIEAILEQARLRRSGEVEGPLRVVDDQCGSPTYAADLAEGLRALVGAGANGIHHLCNAGSVTWWGFARAILDESGHADLEIEPSRTADLNLPAERPGYSVLDCSAADALGVTLRGWREALVAYLASPDCTHLCSRPEPS